MSIVLLCSVLFIVLFLIYDAIKTDYYLKKHQEEWDKLKAKTIEENPDISRWDLMDKYICFCKDKETFFPRF